MTLFFGVFDLCDEESGGGNKKRRYLVTHSLSRVLSRPELIRNKKKMLQGQRATSQHIISIKFSILLDFYFIFLFSLLSLLPMPFPIVTLFLI